MGAEAVKENVFSIFGYIKENYSILVMLCGIFVVYFSSRRPSMPRMERLMPIMAIEVFSCSLLDYIEDYYASLDTYHIQRGICYTLENALYTIILFMAIYTLTPYSKRKFVVIPLSVNIIYCILVLFNTKLTAHYTEDNRFERGYLGYLPVVIDILYLGLLFFYSQQHFRENRILRRNLFLYITITLTLSCVLLIFEIINELNTIGIFCILLYNLHYTITQQANTRRELMMADMQLYQRQIRPHFIYNGLGLIRSLLPREESEAKDVLDHFTRYLRGNAEILTATGLIPFSKEMDIVDNYLYMAEKRFEDSLTIEKDLKDMDFSVPAFSVQILVENAVRHGIRKKEDGKGALWISSYNSNKYHTIVVRDNGTGFDTKELVYRWEEESRIGGRDWNEIQGSDADRGHLGLINLRKRLEIQCGGRIIVTSKTGKGTTAKIMIPIRNNENRQENTRE